MPNTRSLASTHDIDVAVWAWLSELDLVVDTHPLAREFYKFREACIVESSWGTHVPYTKHALELEKAIFRTEKFHS
jgi:hypothetical protein